MSLSERPNWPDEAAIREKAASAVERIIDTGAAIMVGEPWRITRAVYPYLPSHWPLENKPVDGVLAECRASIRGEAKRGEAGHWTYDYNRHVALLQAERALLAMQETEARRA